MANTNSEQVVRECAFDIIKIAQTHKDDNAKLIKALQAPLKRIVAQPDLLSLGVKRQGNHIDNSKYLYYDGQLVISLDEFPKGKRIPPHDHGVWEALAVYKGSFDHTVYERKDDGTRKATPISRWLMIAGCSPETLRSSRSRPRFTPSSRSKKAPIRSPSSAATTPKSGTTSSRKKRPAWSASRRS